MSEAARIARAVPPLGLLGAAFFYPLALIALRALHGDGATPTLAPFIALAHSALFANAVLHTVEIALLASAGCLLLGFALALALAFVPLPGAVFVMRLIDTYIALPTFLLTLAFTFIYGSAGFINGELMRELALSSPPLHFLYSIWGVVLAEVTAYTPFVLRPLLAAFEQFDLAQIDVASSLGARPWRIVRSIIAPAALPALMVGGSLCLLLTVNEFGIVLFIGAKGVVTLPLLIYSKAILEGDYTGACAAAVANVALSLALYALYNRALARFGSGHAGLV
ncbi:putative 2-aminoethylphosphonate transport system permease protein PhnU [mine drainage metagenome]|jgi:2-aminoethylphosphonate transport system permease protein|uniref:Putative 2-aminoethylphosphonate transport system permease protein PhnU n=1 Tax=mine drainage metagenome TaxID=410659 RepID=A0A1J5QP50_9ZZZZ